MKNIFLIVGCSGSGKTTIVEQLEQRYGLKSIQSYTTRPKRYETETGHIFVTDEEFDKLTDFVGYTEFGNPKKRYCATSAQVETHDLYVIDPKGVDYFRGCYKGNKGVKVIYIHADTQVRYHRMVNRAQDKTHIQAVDAALNRIQNDVVEFYDYIHNKADQDYTVDNNSDNLDVVVDKVYQYICNCEKEVM